MDEQRPFTEFSGVAGRVLAESISPSTFVSGLVLGIALLSGVALFGMAGANALGMAFAQVLIGFVLVRFALNGLHGEWRGTLFSSVGGGLPEVASATLRYLALSAVLIVPAIVLSPAEGILPGMTGGAATGVRGALLLAWAVASTLAPPVFLVMAVSVERLGDLASPDAWRVQFAGRLRDLVALYVVYLGGLAMAVLVTVPLGALAFALAPKLGAVVAGGIVCLLFGLAVTLAGRLCGFFACGELGIWDGSAGGEVAPVGPVDGGPASDADPPAPADHDGWEPAVDPGATRAVAPTAPAGATRAVSMAVPSPEATQVAASSPAGGSDSGETTRMMMPTVSDAAGSPDSDTGESAAYDDPGATRVVADTAPGVDAPTPRVRRSPSAEPWPEPPPPAERRPPLLDAAQRVEVAMRRFSLEPAVAVGALQELDAAFAPDPHVLAALATCHYRSGRIESAIELANRALPMIVERGLFTLAAELFKTMRPHLDRLDLDRDGILLVAGEMAKNDDLAGAAKAYSTVIGRDPDEARAIKGLLQVAERLLAEANRPAAAVRVYRYLLEHCSSSPLADFMRNGLDEAERETASRGQPVGS